MGRETLSFGTLERVPDIVRRHVSPDVPVTRRARGLSNQVRRRERCSRALWRPTSRRL